MGQPPLKPKQQKLHHQPVNQQHHDLQWGNVVQHQLQLHQRLRFEEQKQKRLIQQHLSEVKQQLNLQPQLKHQQLVQMKQFKQQHLNEVKQQLSLQTQPKHQQLTQMKQLKQKQLTQVPKLLKQQQQQLSQEQLEDDDDETDSSQFIVVDPSVLLDYPEES